MGMFTRAISKEAQSLAGTARNFVRERAAGVGEAAMLERLGIRSSTGGAFRTDLDFATSKATVVFSRGEESYETLSNIFAKGKKIDDIKLPLSGGNISEIGSIRKLNEAKANDAKILGFKDAQKQYNNFRSGGTIGDALTSNNLFFSSSRRKYLLSQYDDAIKNLRLTKSVNQQMPSFNSMTRPINTNSVGNVKPTGVPNMTKPLSPTSTARGAQTGHTQPVNAPKNNRLENESMHDWISRTRREDSGRVVDQMSKNWDERILNDLPRARQEQIYSAERKSFIKSRAEDIRRRAPERAKRINELRKQQGKSPISTKHNSRIFKDTKNNFNYTNAVNAGGNALISGAAGMAGGLALGVAGNMINPDIMETDPHFVRNAMMIGATAGALGVASGAAAGLTKAKGASLMAYDMAKMTKKATDSKIMAGAFAIAGFAGGVDSHLCRSVNQSNFRNTNNSVR